MFVCALDDEVDCVIDIGRGVVDLLLCVCVELPYFLELDVKVCNVSVLVLHDAPRLDRPWDAPERALGEAGFSGWCMFVRTASCCFPCAAAFS
jgi:hypothetical protein